MNITKNYHSISASCTSKLQIIKKNSKLRQFVKPLFQDLSIFYLEFLVENVSKYSERFFFWKTVVRIVAANDPSKLLGVSHFDSVSTTPLLLSPHLNR